jgi:hypothetical protein
MALKKQLAGSNKVMRWQIAGMTRKGVKLYKIMWNSRGSTL